MDDWSRHTQYRGGYSEDDQVVKWFWEVSILSRSSHARSHSSVANEKVVRSWDMERKSRLLQFTTGTSRIPVNGFKDLQGSDGPRRFTLEK